MIPRLAVSLHNELPDVKGFSERNVKRMLAFYREYRGLVASSPQAATPIAPASKVTQPVAQIHTESKVPPPVALLRESLFWTVPWAHHVILIEKIKDISRRRWYMEQTLANSSMSSNQSNEGEIRKAIIEADLVDCMVALPGRQDTQSITTYSDVRN